MTYYKMILIFKIFFIFCSETNVDENISINDLYIKKYHEFENFLKEENFEKELQQNNSYFHDAINCYFKCWKRSKVIQEYNQIESCMIIIKTKEINMFTTSNNKLNVKKQYQESRMDYLKNMVEIIEQINLLNESSLEKINYKVVFDFIEKIMKLSLNNQILINELEKNNECKSSTLKLSTDIHYLIFKEITIWNRTIIDSCYNFKCIHHEEMFLDDFIDFKSNIIKLIKNRHIFLQKRYEAMKLLIPNL